jgi:hypothetical protein
VGVLGSEELLAVASVVVTPSARERFTPRELTDAYEQFIERIHFALRYCRVLGSA